MIRLYVESNFILEHVLQHDESPHVEKIIALAEERSIDLAIPTLALLEPFSTVTNNANRRNSLSNSFTQQLRARPVRAHAPARCRAQTPH